MTDCDYRGVSVDYFIRCEVPGCETRVLCLTGVRYRCLVHGGPTVPQFTDLPDAPAVGSSPDRAAPLIAG